MSKWNKLPIEVLNLVFNNDNFTRKDYYQCLLVCKEWKISSEIYLYKSVVLGKTRRLYKFIACLEKSRLGSLVKKIDLFDLVSPLNYDDIEGVLRRIASLCPNVEYLTAAEEPCHSFWLDLVYLSFAYWSNLKQIPDPNVNFVEYTLCTFTFKNSLRRIAIPNCHPQSVWGQDVIRHLKYFPHVDTVVIKHGARVLRLIDYDPIIEECPQLICLEACIKEYKGDDDLLDWEEQDASLSIQYSINELKPRPNVKRLNVEINYDPSLLSYIMHKFPNLQELQMIIHAGGTTRHHHEYSTVENSKFSEYVLKIPKHSVRLTCSPQNACSLLEMTRPKELQMQMKYNTEYASFTPLLFETTTRPLTIEMNSDKPTRLMSACSLQRSVLKEIWKGCKNSVEKLHFSTGAEMYEYISFNDEKSKWLEDILRNCQKLNTLHLTCVNLDPPASEVVRKKLINPSVENLSLKIIRYEQKVLTQYLSLLPSLKSFKLISYIQITGKRDNVFDIKIPHAALEKLDVDLSFFWDKSCYLWKSSSKESPQNLRIKAVLLHVFPKKGLKRSFVLKNLRGKLTVKEGTSLPKSSYSVTLRVYCKSLQIISTSIGAVDIKNHPLYVE